MIRRRFWFSLLAMISLVSWTAGAKASRRSHTSSDKPIKGDGKHRTDPEMRTLIRKHAPFYIDERFRNDTIRVNKDGTFSREGEDGSYLTEGHWRIATGKLKLKWSTGEEYGYRMTFLGYTPLVVGHKPNRDNHYVIISAD